MNGRGYQSFPWWQWPRQGREAPLDQTEEIREMQEELARIDACAAKKRNTSAKVQRKISCPEASRTAQASRSGQQEFREQQAQSQMRAQLSNQAETVQLLINEVRKLDDETDKESSALSGMTRDVLAMNRSLRASTARNGLEIGELAQHQRTDEAQILQTGQTLSGLLQTQQQDELKLTNHEGSINKLGQVQLEDETKLGQTAQQVVGMVSQVESVDESQKRISSEFTAAEEKLNHQSHSLESLAKNISGLGKRLKDTRTEFQGALQSHGAEILQNKESLDSVDQQVSALQASREKDIKHLLDLSKNHEALSTEFDAAQERHSREMFAVNESVSGIIHYMRKARDAVAALNQSRQQRPGNVAGILYSSYTVAGGSTTFVLVHVDRQQRPHCKASTSRIAFPSVPSEHCCLILRDLLGLFDETSELKELMEKVRAQVSQQGEHLDNLTEKHWNKERVGEVCKDLAQWLEQLAMLLSLYHIHILDLEGDRGRLATELRTTKAKYQQGDEEKKDAVRRFQEIEARWNEEKMKRRAEVLFGVSCNEEDPKIYSQMEVDDMYEQWKKEQVDPLLDEIKALRKAQRELLAKMEAMKYERASRNSIQQEEEPLIGEAEFRLLQSALKASSSKVWGDLSPLLTRMAEQLALPDAGPPEVVEKEAATLGLSLEISRDPRIPEGSSVIGPETLEWLQNLCGSGPEHLLCVPAK
eukprot:s1937_g9.t1